MEQYKYLKYKNKYLKYKNKYNIYGGGAGADIIDDFIFILPDIIEEFNKTTTNLRDIIQQKVHLLNQHAENIKDNIKDYINILLYHQSIDTIIEEKIDKNKLEDAFNCFDEPYDFQDLLPPSSRHKRSQSTTSTHPHPRLIALPPIPTTLTQALNCDQKICDQYCDDIIEKWISERSNSDKSYHKDRIFDKFKYKLLYYLEQFANELS